MNVGSLTLGALDGLLIGLLAVGLVLVYRSSRFLNLAHGQLGALGALLLAKLVVDRGWGYWPALLLCLIIGAGTGILVERELRARFDNDDQLHQPKRQEAEQIRAQLLAAKKNGASLHALAPA